MKHIEALVIGGGQAGLAMSRSLTDRGIEHVVLERGRIGERWRSQRWDSLRLQTPNWQSRLPGYRFAGPDPEGFMPRGRFVDVLEAYARCFSAPVLEDTSVLSVRPSGGRYRVVTDAGTFDAASVIVATGHSDRPLVPPIAQAISTDVLQVVPTIYKKAADLPEGGVLVVGASASGVQLVEEIHRSGRPVTLSAGRHIRMPRRYRGRDILEWLDLAGILDETPGDVHDVEASRRQPSMQLVGSSEPRDLDLGVLAAQGVRVVGRAIAARGDHVRFADDLERNIESAEAKLRRLLARVDTFIGRNVPRAWQRPREPRSPIRIPAAPTELRLSSAGIRSVVWATGYRRSYEWLGVPVLDARGEIQHSGGVTPSPGLYVLGLHFLRHRNSNFIDGVGRDAAFLAAHLEAYLGQRPVRAA